MAGLLAVSGTRPYAAPVPLGRGGLQVASRGPVRTGRLSLRLYSARCSGRGWKRGKPIIAAACSPSPAWLAGPGGLECQLHRFAHRIQREVLF